MSPAAKTDIVIPTKSEREENVKQSAQCMAQKHPESLPFSCLKGERLLEREGEIYVLISSVLGIILPRHSGQQSLVARAKTDL